MKCPHQTDLVAPFLFLLPFLRELQSKATLLENPGSEN